MESGTCRPNGDELQGNATNAAAIDSPPFTHNTLQYKFSERGITANGIKTFSAFSKSANKPIFETKFSHTNEQKMIWLECHGYSYED